MARILWLGDAGCTTGFGRVSHAIGDRLVTDYGHDISCLAVNYLGDYWPTPMKLYRPNKLSGNDMFGLTRYVEMLAEVMPEVTVMLQDPYVILKHLLRNNRDPELMMARTAPILAYMPVDGTNQPSTWQKLPEIVNKLPAVKGGKQPSLTPVVMTEFGRTLYPEAPLVYHGVDTNTYHKVSAANPVYTSTGRRIASKADAKAVLGFSKDSFLVIRVDRNSHRKNYGDTWRALVPVMKRHDDISAWMHCKAEGDQLELPQILSREPEIAQRFKFPGDLSTFVGWSESDLVTLYNAADLFVSTSWGEGFGLTLAEAAACEVPIIAQNVSSIPEVVGPGGILIDPERLIAVDSGEDQWLPSVGLFSEAIERLYADRKLRAELGAAGRSHVVANFNWDRAAQQFDRLISEVISGGSYAA